MPCLAAVDTYERMAQNAPGRCGHGVLYAFHRCSPGFLKGIGALRCGEPSGRPDGRPGRRGIPAVATAAVNWPGGFCVLELDEQHVRGRGTGVLARVGLGWQPVGAARFHDDIARAPADVQPALECRQRVHHAVGVLVRESLAAGQVAVLKHAHPVVLKMTWYLSGSVQTGSAAMVIPSSPAALSQIFVDLNFI